MSNQPASETQTFPVNYDANLIYNRDFAGTGEMVVGPEGITFSGAKRLPLFRGSMKTLTFTRDQIQNVTQRENGVQFRTALGVTGQKKVPFVFYCDSPTAAAAVVALLPTTKDDGYTESAGFQQKLQEIAPAPNATGYATNWIVAANVLAFVVMGLFGAGWFEPESMRPYMLFAANNGAATTNGEWWRLVTAMFAHYGLLHLVLNMWALFQVGHLVERLFGRALYTLIYFSAGITGSLATLVWHGDKIWSAGASGAIFGVYGALLGYLGREKHGIPKTVLQPMMKSTLVFAGYNLVYGAIQPQIDNMAHIGGLVGGALFGWICALPLDRDVRTRETGNRLAIGSGMIAAILLVGMLTAPRFNYSVTDELRWNDVVESRIKQEQALLQTEQKVLAGATRTSDPRVVTYVRDTAMPFYGQWETDIRALPLTTGKLTAVRRDGLVQVFDLKLQIYRKLLAACERGDADAFTQYERDQTTIVSALSELKKQLARLMPQG